MQRLERSIGSRLQGMPASLAVTLPTGRRLGPPVAAVSLRFEHWRDVADLALGRIGRVGEAYVEHRLAIEAPMRDLMAVAAHLLRGDPVASGSGWWPRLRHRLRSRLRHTPRRDERQVRFHYDLSDRFHALWLDPLRVYSCAYWASPGLTLAQAQQAKLDLVCRKLMLRPGDRLLDIGAGWGGLLLWAAQHYGVEATGITLSQHQHAHVQERIDALGLRGRVRVLLQDYRSHDDGPYDRIASVGMFEHVGRAQMPRYCRSLARLLRPGGLLLNHGITAGGTGATQLGAGLCDFIEKYIFPGGELLHASEVLRHLADAGLEVVDLENLRPHYARTLWAWSDALESRLDEAHRVLAQDLGERDAGRVLRAYRLYLAGSAMGFEHGWMALHQALAVAPGAQSGYPFTRDHLYRDAATPPCSTSSNPRPPAT